jgi:hypothetical protein
VLIKTVDYDIIYYLSPDFYDSSQKLIDEPTGKIYDEEVYYRILTNQLSSIFSQCQAIKNDSCIKVLYRNANFEPLKEKDYQSLANFELSFFSLDQKVMNYKECILSELCKSL